MRKLNLAKRAALIGVSVLALVFSTNVSRATEDELPSDDDQSICRCHTSSQECHLGHAISFRPRCSCDQPVEFCEG